MSSPSSHQRGQLVAEAHGDHRKAVALLAQQFSAIAGDKLAQDAAIPEAGQVTILSELADGLEIASDG